MVLIIKKEGIFTSVQDLGKYGLQRLGINPRGAMDRTAVRIINLLLGNDEKIPVLEMHFPVGEIVFEETCRFALGGAEFGAQLDGVVVPNWCVLTAPASGLLRFKKKAPANRCYLAVEGGLRADPPASCDVPDPLYSTVRLRSGARLMRLAEFNKNAPPTRRRVSTHVLPHYSSSPTVRMIAGGEFDLLSENDKGLLETTSFEISNESNRMGFRLRGPAMTIDPPFPMISSAVAFGTVQLVPDGQMIVLMADHQTTGGYPRIGAVISADLPVFAQLGAGDRVWFRLVGIEEAEAASVMLERNLRWLKLGLSFGR